MLEPAPLMTAVMSARRPARSRARMVSCTGKVASEPPPHSTAMRRSEKAGEDLAGGIFSETNGGVEILRFGKTVVGNKFVDVGFRDFLEAAAEVARFVFEQALTHFRGFFAFLLVDPVANLAFRRG